MAARLIFHLAICACAILSDFATTSGKFLGVLPTDRPGVTRPTDPPALQTAASGAPTDRPASSPPGDAQTQLNFAPPERETCAATPLCLVGVAFHWAFVLLQTIV